MSSSPALIETAEQTEQDTYTTRLSARHLLNPNTSLKLTFNQDIRDVAQFTSSWEWFTLDWLDCQFWPRFSAGIGWWSFATGCPRG